LFGVRVGSETVGAFLPLGPVWADALKPPLLRQRCDVPLPTGVAAVAIRKQLLVLSQAAYLGLGFLLGGAALERGFAKATGVSGLRFLALFAAFALFLVATAMAALLGRGNLFQSLLAHPAAARWPTLHARLVKLGHAAHGLDRAAAAFFQASFRVRARSVLAFLAAWLLESTETWLILNALGERIGWGDALGIDALVVLSRSLLPLLPG